MTALGWVLGNGPEINAEQNLFVARCKHWYLTDKGQVRQQKAVVSARATVSKIPLTRMIAYDQGTGVFYSEFHAKPDASEIIAFLARAWSNKGDHPMHGVPTRLNLSSTMTAAMKRHVAQLTTVCGVQLGTLDRGFGTGSGHAAACMDRELERNAAQARKQMPNDPSWLAGCAAVLSCRACASAVAVSAQSWARVNALPVGISDWVDGQLGTSWREFPWTAVLDGMGH